MARAGTSLQRRDGVGTKLKIAVATGIHSTVGGDLVNHCVNDILTLGATPLFFLDYLAMGKLNPDTIESVMEGISRACHAAGCALIGGETAEMPGFYAPGEYDLAGFIVGVMERANVKKTSAVKAGDLLFALPSTGLHTNGYSLARKLVFEQEGLQPDTYVAEIGNKIGAELLRLLHKCYWPMLEDNRRARDGYRRWHISPAEASSETCLACCRAACRRKSSWVRGPCRRSFLILRAWANWNATNCCARSTWASENDFGGASWSITRAPEAELKRRREKFYRIGHIRTGDPRKPQVSALPGASCRYKVFHEKTVFLLICSNIFHDLRLVRPSEIPQDAAFRCD